MNISNFLSTLNGNWLAQQTVHNLYLESNSSHKCEVIYKPIPNNNELISSILDSYPNKYSHIDALEVAWINKNMKTSYELSYTLYFFTLKDTAYGRFIKWNKNGNLVPTQGKFRWNKNGILNFTTQKESIYIDEKFYMPSDKLRLSTSIVKQYGICTQVSFVSEIKFNQ